MSVIMRAARTEERKRPTITAVEQQSPTSDIFVGRPFLEAQAETAAPVSPAAPQTVRSEPPSAPIAAARFIEPEPAAGTAVSPAPAPPLNDAAPAEPPQQQPAQKKDANWQRLQTIMRRHDRQDSSGEAETVEPQPSPRASRILGRKPVEPKREPPLPPSERRAAVTYVEPPQKERQAEIQPGSEQAISEAAPPVQPAQIQRAAETSEGQTPSMPIGDETEAAGPGAEETIPAFPVPKRESDNVDEASMRPLETSDRLSTKAPSVETESSTDATAEVSGSPPIPASGSKSVSESDSENTFAAEPVYVPLSDSDIVSRTADDSNTDGADRVDLMGKTAVSSGHETQESEESVVSELEPLNVAGKPTAVEQDAPVAQDFPAPAGLPLQAIWPVQRKEVDDTPDSPTGGWDKEVSAAMHQRTNLPEFEQTRKILDDVPPTGPTDSTVELILPRRPRPARAAPTETTERPDIHRKDDPAAGPQERLSPQMVQTEIGPLPGDLWELLERPAAGGPAAELPETMDNRVIEQPVTEDCPESIQKTADTEVDMSTVIADRKPSLSRAPQAMRKDAAVVETAPARKATESSRKTAVQTPPQVQRLEAPDDAAVPEQETGSAERQEAEVDIDLLARQVFANIKRRLAIEWERGRGRL